MYWVLYSSYIFQPEFSFLYNIINDDGNWTEDTQTERVENGGKAGD